MKKSIKIFLGLLIVGGTAFAYTSSMQEYLTFCHEEMGGKGICIVNGNMGFKCEPVDFLGDCKGTFAREIPTVE